jgi:mannose-6-phosphate isomerase-like protein (cupin superfamily)
MKRHEILDNEARDKVVGYVFGMLDGEAAARYESHLADCTACRAEAAALHSIVEDLSLLALPLAPPDRLKSKLLERIRSRRAGSGRVGARETLDPPGFRAVQGASADSRPTAGPARKKSPGPPDRAISFVLASRAVWKPMDLQGVEACPLHMDSVNDHVTMLVRMAPGTSYPEHHHDYDEECYVIEGDLLVGETPMRAGDYQRAPAGSVHPVQFTEAGCLLLVVTGLREILPAPNR